MKSSIFAFLLLVNSSNICAQLLDPKHKYLDNPDIIWAVEVIKDYTVDNIPKSEENLNNHIFTLKRNSQWIKEDISDYQYDPLSQILEEAIFSNQTQIFEDSTFLFRKDTNQLIWVDTIVPNDAPMRITKTKIGFNDMYEYRVHMLVSFDVKKSRWNLEVLSVAPLYDVKDDAGNFLYKKPLFWIKVNNSRPDIASNDIIWAKRITDRKRFIYTWRNKNHRVFFPLKPFKESVFNHIENYIEKMEKDSSLKVYSSEEKRLLQWKEKFDIMHRVDTILSEGKTYIVTSKINIDEIRELRLVHNWYWDDNKKQLYIWLERVAPMGDVMDDWGNFLYARPLLYWYNED